MKKIGLFGLMLALAGVGVFVRGLGKERPQPARARSQARQVSPERSLGRTELAADPLDPGRQEILRTLEAEESEESVAPLVIRRERGTPVDAALRGQLSSRCGMEGVSEALVLAWGRGPDVDRIDELALALGKLRHATPFEISEALRGFESFGVCRADESGAFALDLRGVVPPICIFAAKPGFASIRMWVDLEDIDRCSLALEPLYQARVRLQDGSGRELRIGRAERKMKHKTNSRRRGTRVDPIWAMAGISKAVLEDVDRFKAFVFTGGSCRGESDGPWRFEIDAPGFHPGVLEFVAGRVGTPARVSSLTLRSDGTEVGLGSVAVFPTGLPFEVSPQQIHAELALENEGTGEVKKGNLHLAAEEEALFFDDLDTGLWRLRAKDSRHMYIIPELRIEVSPGLVSPAPLDYSEAAFLYARDPRLAPGLEPLRQLVSISYSEAEQERRRAQGHTGYVATAPGSPTPLPVGPEIWLWYRTGQESEEHARTYEEEIWVAPRAGHVRIIE